MMDFEEFTEDIYKEICVRFDGTLQVMKKEVVKNNNVKLTGLVVFNGETNIGPCVYLDGFYREYESEGMEFDEIVEEIYRLLQKHRDEATAKVDLSELLKWETVRKNIHAKLINAEQNRELLETIPHRIFMDLAVVYYVVVRDHLQEEFGTFLICNKRMEQWGQEEENLYQTALQNMRADGEADLISIETAMSQMLPGFTFPEKDGNAPRDTDMYILTNRHKRYGAAEILDKKTLRMVADQVGDGYIVLPCSVHETIILPPKDETEYGTLAGLVQEVNDTQVDIEERLSYHVYVYSRSEEMLKIAA